MINAYGELFTKIENSGQFNKICASQKVNKLDTSADMVEAVEKFKSMNKEYTIFSIQSTQDEDIKCNLAYGIVWDNTIGFYVLEGNFTLSDNILLN